MTTIFLVLLALGGFQATDRVEYRIFVPSAYLNNLNTEWAQRGVKQKLTSVHLTQHTRHGVLSSITAAFSMTCGKERESTVVLLLSGFPDAPKEIKEELDFKKFQIIGKAEDAQHVLLNSKDFRDTFFAHLKKILEGACGSALQREYHFTVSFWSAVNEKGELTNILYVTNPSTKEMLERLR